MLKHLKMRRLTSEGQNCPPIKRIKTMIPSVLVLVEQAFSRTQETLLSCQMPATSSIAELKSAVQDHIGIAADDLELFNSEEGRVFDGLLNDADRLSDADRLCHVAAAVDGHHPEQQKTYRFVLSIADPEGEPSFCPDSDRISVAVDMGSESGEESGWEVSDSPISSMKTTAEAEAYVAPWKSNPRDFFEENRRQDMEARALRADTIAGYSS
jgi:hypothetical protein